MNISNAQVRTNFGVNWVCVCEVVDKIAFHSKLSDSLNTSELRISVYKSDYSFSAASPLSTPKTDFHLNRPMFLQDRFLARIIKLVNYGLESKREQTKSLRSELLMQRIWLSAILVVRNSTTEYWASLRILTNVHSTKQVSERMIRQREKFKIN